MGIDSMNDGKGGNDGSIQSTNYAGLERSEVADIVDGDVEDGERQKTPEALATELSADADDLIARAMAVKFGHRTDEHGDGLSVGTNNVYGSTGEGADSLRVGERVLSGSGEVRELVNVIRWRKQVGESPGNFDLEAGPATGAYAFKEFGKGNEYGRTIFIDAPGHGNPKLRPGINNTGSLEVAVEGATSILERARQAIEEAETRQRAAEEALT